MNKILSVKLNYSSGSRFVFIKENVHPFWTKKVV
jgi:hypothetical protein